MTMGKKDKFIYSKAWPVYWCCLLKLSRPSPRSKISVQENLKSSSYLMASIGLCASINGAFSSHCSSMKPPLTRGPRASSLRTEQETHVAAPTIDGHKHLTSIRQEENPLWLINTSKQANNEMQHLKELEPSGTKFSDGRWRNGTWDLNMFVKRGKIDWHAVISAEARRRRFLELYPEAATNEEAVLFKSSMIPWWAWITHSHLPEAELLNGRVAMVGFFMSYLVDALTRLDLVGQTGNFVCKAAFFITVIGVVLFRRKDDFENLPKVADEATFYDKQWQSSWKDQRD